MTKTKKLPARSQVKPADTWDLSSLFPNDEAWETAFGKWEQQIAKYAKFRGTLGDRRRRWPSVSSSTASSIGSASGWAPTPF